MVTATTITRENITCRHCKVTGIHNFERRIEHLLDATAVDSIICRICGDRLASRLLSTVMERPVDQQPEPHHNFSCWPACAKPGCTSHLRPHRVAAGETLCSRCAKAEAPKKVPRTNLPEFLRSGLPKLSIDGVDIPIITGTEIVLNAAPPASETIRNPHWIACATPDCTRRLRPNRVTDGDLYCSRCVVARQATRTYKRRGPATIPRALHWITCVTPGCVTKIRPDRVAAGETLCGKCRQHAARRAATIPQEVTHVEEISKLPCLAPPAPPTSAVRHPARRPAQLRRDDHQGVNELSRLLAPIRLYPAAATIVSWSPAERREVGEFVASLSTDNALPMPDVLVPIYDAAYGKKRRA